MEVERLAPDDAAFHGTSAQARAEGVDAAELRERIGFEPFITELYPGVDRLCEVYPCRIGKTFPFGLVRGLEGEVEGRVEVWTHRADQIALVALALDLRESWFAWRSAPGARRPWQTFRQDDNGNTFELARFEEEEDAALHARLWNDWVGAHKQSAFVRRL